MFAGGLFGVIVCEEAGSCTSQRVTSYNSQVTNLGGVCYWDAVVEDWRRKGDNSGVEHK